MQNFFFSFNKKFNETLLDTVVSLLFTGNCHFDDHTFQTYSKVEYAVKILKGHRGFTHYKCH